ncbi:hypothetical protein BGX34_003413 [Mortierella sp. NVP85]|nr:hypothetical protein BGX34_003413 [Mortierella sp. NVP85]
MPPRFAPAPSPRCPQCSKAAEQVIGPNGASWHKSCFVCVRCNRRLDTSTLAEHEGKAYCQPCHKLVWGPTGYGFGSGLVPEDPENQFKQSIGRPVNSSSNDDMEDGVARHPTGGSNNNYNSSFVHEETEEERRERLTPVNASLQRRNSLEMIRQQAEASRRAYDEAYTQRLNANRNNPVHPNFTGGSTTSTGSKGDAYNLDGGYGSDSSSAFGSTMATTSSPAPSLSSVSSSTSSQPATKTLYLNQPIKSVGRVPSPQSQDPDSDYAKSRQALSYQTGAPSISPGPPSLPKRSPEPVNPIPRSSTGGSQDDNASRYAPVRIVARKEEPPAAAQAVDDDEWDTAEPAQKPQEPMYLSQYLKQQKQKEQQQQQQQQQQQHSTISTPSSGPPSLPKRSVEPVAPMPSSHTGDKQQRDDSYSDYIPVRIVARKEEPPTSTTTTTTSAVADDEWDTEPAQKPQAPPMYQSQYLKQQKQAERSPMSTPSVLSSFNTRSSNPLLNEADRLHMREQEERHQRAAQDNANAVERDEWDEEPTPTVPSKPQNLKYTSAYTPPSVGPRTMPTSYGNDLCRVCQKVVYHAEMARAHGSIYHKSCLKCFSCQKSVDATNMVDRKGTPYCKHCYSKEFGAKGYGYGAGANVLHTEL